MISNRLWRRLTAALIVFSIGFSPIAPVHAQTRKKTAIPAPNFLVIAAGKDSYRVVETRNSSGRVVRQMLIGQERREISLDKNGDGFLDGWILRTPNASVEMSEPRRGQFRLMEVEHRFEKENVTMKFILNSRTGLYSLYEAKRVPHRVMYDDFKVGCDMGESKRIHKDADELREFLDVDRNAKNLKSSLVENLFPNECKEGDFKGSTDLIAAGILDVASSDSDPNGRPSEKGKYLQCLRYFELDFHAAKIAAAIEEFRLGKPTKASWQLRCQKAKNKNHYGSYSSGGTPPAIAILRPKETLTGGGGAAALDDEKFYTNSYAATFFHEMLHYSGLDDSVAHDIEQCCSSEVEDTGRACAAVRKMVRSKKFAQMFQAGLDEELGGYGSGYDLYRNIHRDIFGADTADANIDEFERGIGELYSKYANIDACHKVETDRVYGTCESQFRDEFNQLVKSSFQVEGCFTAARNNYIAQVSRGMPLNTSQADVTKSKAEAHAKKVCDRLTGFMNAVYGSDLGACKNYCTEDDKTDGTLAQKGSLIRWALALAKAHASTLDDSKFTTRSESASDEICEWCDFKAKRQITATDTSKAPNPPGGFVGRTRDIPPGTVRGQNQNLKGEPPPDLKSPVVEENLARTVGNETILAPPSENLHLARFEAPVRGGVAPTPTPAPPRVNSGGSSGGDGPGGSETLARPAKPSGRDEEAKPPRVGEAAPVGGGTPRGSDGGSGGKPAERRIKIRLPSEADKPVDMSNRGGVITENTSPPPDRAASGAVNSAPPPRAEGPSKGSGLGGLSRSEVGGVSRAPLAGGMVNQERFPSAEAKGPRRLSFSEPGVSNSDRERAILQHLEKGDSVIERTRVFAERAVKQILPSAQAATLGSDPQLLNDMKGAKTADQNTDRSQSRSPASVSVDTGRFAVPGPFDGPKGQAIANAKSGLNSKSSEGDPGPDTNDGSIGEREKEKDGGSGKLAGLKAGGSGSASSGAGIGLNRAPAADSKNKAGLKPIDLLLKQLMGPYKESIQLLGRPEIISKMIQYRVQVIDHKGNFHGSNKPSYLLKYDKKIRRLKLMSHPDL